MKQGATAGNEGIRNPLKLQKFNGALLSFVCCCGTP
ncbi:MAG: hypothetical protein K0S45_3698 [Nitrospira sp.]|nr:hypothetical protein [Nitrospira sp.]